LVSGKPEEKLQSLLLIQKFCRWKELSPEVINILKNQNEDENLRLSQRNRCNYWVKKEAVESISDLLNKATGLDTKHVCITALGYLGGDKAKGTLLIRAF